MSGRTLFEKVWSDHVVVRSPQGEELLYVDFNMINEGQSFLAFDQLGDTGRAAITICGRQIMISPTPQQVTIDRVFIGSCTNSRIEDLRAAAKVLKGRKASVPGMVSPGSHGVKRQAEAEGLHQIFLDAGLEWREPGCSMCNGSNGELVAPGERCASTTNRNFEGRQGRGALTHIMSPAMVAAAAVHGTAQRRAPDVSPDAAVHGSRLPSLLRWRLRKSTPA